MNNTREVSKPIYDLRPEDFERLVGELLRAENFRIQERFFWPRGADLIATKGEDTFIVQIKHRQALSTGEVMADFDQYIAGEDLAQKLLLVTSAKISAQQAANLKAFRPGHELSIIALQELDRLLSAHPEIAGRFLSRARRRRSFQNLNLAAAALGSLASLVALIVALVGHFSKQPQPLDKRIQTVEATLTSIRDLEGYLGKIKQDMVATDLATRGAQQAPRRRQGTREADGRSIADLEASLAGRKVAEDSA